MVQDTKVDSELGYEQSGERQTILEVWLLILL
jgi:hypothetical protein